MLNLRHKLLALALLIAAVPAFTMPSHAIAQAAKAAATSATPLDINTATADDLKALVEWLVGYWGRRGHGKLVLPDD